MTRLYQKIYLTILGSLLAVVLVAGALQQVGRGPGPMEQGTELISELAFTALPPSGASRDEQARAIARLAARLDSELALFDMNRQPIAFSGRPLPPPGPRPDGPVLFYGGPGPEWGVRLPDGRWLVMRLPPRRRTHPVIAIVLFLGAIAGVVTLCAFPVVRGLTRRIERLQRGVDTLGAGNLGARVEVEGRDEVARLAVSFNHAAARIESLMGAHRLLLANASHELRTPLSRIRLGLELLNETGDQKYRLAVQADLAELDELIEEILLASRLDAGRGMQVETVDLLALAAEECARYADCRLEGEAAIIEGDPRLLRRMIRNLLENAHRHGAPPVDVTLRLREAGIEMEVADQGPGIAAAEQERIFEPFYQVERSGKGTGLGLSLVRRIARLHGGDAEVVPRPLGACLRVKLAAGSTADKA